MGLEPSCVSVFRDELTSLFPHDEDAKRLRRQTFLLSEFLEQRHVDLPQLHRRALVQGHCHHKAVLQMDSEVAVLARLELDLEIPDSGCCGMAGSFGYEPRNYDVSVRAGERVLLPAVRGAPADTLIIANGFSCADQIRQTTNRRALHLAEVIQLARRYGPDGPPSGYPEAVWGHNDMGVASRRSLRTAAGVLGALAFGALVWAGSRREET